MRLESSASAGAGAGASANPPRGLVEAEAAAAALPVAPLPVVASPVVPTQARKPTAPTPIMSTVKDLIGRFGTRAAAAPPPASPADFERKKREIAQREAEQIRLARERAQQYNSSLRSKRLAAGLGEDGKSGGGGGGVSAKAAAGAAAQPGGGKPASATGSQAELARLASDSSMLTLDAYARGLVATGSMTDVIVPVNLSDGVTVVDGVLVHTNDAVSSNPLFRPGSMASASQPGSRPTSQRLSPRADASGSIVLGTDEAAYVVVEGGEDAALALDGGGPPVAAAPTAPETRTAATQTLPPAPAAPASAAEPAAAAAAAATPEPKNNSPIVPPRKNRVGVPPGGFRQIHRVVAMHRPSVSDLLLDPDFGERADSISSVGPQVEISPTVAEDRSRLEPGVEVRTVLETFYQTYAPEKLEDLDLVLDYFKGRTEALLLTLETKYFVSIAPDGIVTPVSPLDAPDPNSVEDERFAARRHSVMSGATDFTDLTTDSFKGYPPQAAPDGSMPKSLAQAWAVPTKHNSGGPRHQWS